MSETPAKLPRVPTRLVIASIVGLWATYFLLTTLRGGLLGYEFNWAFVSRRLIVTLASMGVTAALWPLFNLLARRPPWLRAGVVMLVGLPAALLLTLINSWAFADLDQVVSQREHQKEGVNVLDDGEGNRVEIGNGKMVVRSDDGDVVEMSGSGVVVHEGQSNGSQHSAPPPPPPPLPPGSSAPLPPPPSQSPPAARPEARVPDVMPKDGHEAKGFWDEYADMALGRYFLLLAWMALYLALEAAEKARGAERREGEYRRAAQSAELRSLRYQINPHFLFNTLNSLSALVLTGKQAAAERMIQTLSTFYRRSLAGDPTGDVPLAEEMGLQKLYLEIEALRFPERLRTVVAVPEELADVLVPGMILQPLVENAVKHAVAASKNPVTLEIAARATGDRLILSVADDGPGGGQSPDGCGIGLANVRERLHARFDGAASLEAGPQPQGGFRAEIRLPLLRGHG